MMRLYCLPGKLLVIRDSDIEDYKGIIIRPDVAKIHTQSGFVLLHEVTHEWLDGGELPLRHKRILFDKYSEREFKLDGREFCIVDERDVLAVFSRRDTMLKSDLQVELDALLGSVEGDELSANDLQSISDEIANLAEVEGEVEDPDEEEEKAGDGVEETKDAEIDPPTGAAI